MKKLLVMLTLVCMAVFNVCSYANEKETPSGAMSKVVSESSLELPFAVDVSADRSDRRYVDGETATFNVTSEKDGYLYIFYCDVEGNVTTLFPVARPDGTLPDNKIEAKQNVTIPYNDGGKYLQRFRIQAPFGEELLVALVSTQKLTDIDSMISVDRELSVKGVNRLASVAKAMTVNNYRNPDYSSREQANELPEEKPVVSLAGLTIETFATSADRDKANEEVKTYYVGIGIGKFQSSNFSPLPCCPNDVKDLKELLVSQGCVREENCFLLLDEEATYANIRELLVTKLPILIKPQDRLILFVSSHGCPSSNSSNDNDKPFEFYIVPHDVQKLNTATMLPSADLGTWLLRFKENKTMIIFDACYSGGMLDDKGWNVLQDYLDAPVPKMMDEKSIIQTNMTAIASSTSNESSLTYGRNSMMTHFMLKALKESRDLAADKLRAKICPQVEKASKENKMKGELQTVVYATTLKNGSFVINPSSEDKK